MKRAVVAAILLLSASIVGRASMPVSIKVDSIPADTLIAQTATAATSTVPGSSLLDYSYVPPTPTSAVFSQYGSGQPELSTGAASLHIPIYDLNYKGVSIPFALHYHSNGIKVFDSPYPCGYGWSLSPGLRLTRTVIGRPDEYFDNVAEYSRPTDTELPDKFLKARMCVELKNSPLADSDNRLDSGHDLFVAYLPDRSVAFTLERNSSGEIEFKTYDSTIAITASGKNLSEFIIRDGTGVRYTFAAYEQASELQVYTGWMLERIDLPFGQTIELEWEKHTNPSYRYMPGSVSFQDNYFSLQSPDSYESALVLSNVDGQYYIDPHSEIAALKSVKWPGGKVSVNYNTGVIGSEGLIKEILVTDHNGSQAKQCKLTYDNTRKHHVKSNLPCLLQSVEISGIGRYSFEYDPHNFRSDTEQDLWGYYNANGASALIPRIKMWVRENNSERTFDVKVNGSASRVPNPDVMKAYILTKVIYPTGGSSEYEYEPHRFRDPGLDDDDSIENILSSDNLLNASNICEGGGLRVTKITTSAGDDSPADVRTYAYGRIPSGKTTESGLAICTAMPYYSTFVSRSNLYIDDFRSARINTISGFSNYNHMGYGEPEIWYEYVTEYSAAGKTVYELGRQYENSYLTGNPRIPASLFFSASASPILWSAETYAKRESGYALTNTVRYDYEIPYHTPAGEEVYIVRNYINGKAGGPDFDIPNANISNFVYNHADEIYGTFDYSLMLYETRAAGMTTTTYGDNGVAATVSEEIEFLAGSPYPVKTTVSDGFETRTQTTAYAGHYNASELLSSSEKSQLEAIVAAGMPATPVLWTSTAQNYTAKTQAFYKACGSSFAPVRASYAKGPDTRTIAEWTYDTNGNPLTSEVAGKPRLAMEWDETGLYLTKLTEKGTPDFTWLYEYKPLVGLSSVTDPAGVKTQYTYDNQGRLASIAVEGHGTTDKYDYGIVSTGSSDNYILETKYLTSTGGSATCKYYDGLGRLWQTVQKESTADFSANISSIIDYDALGRPVREWLPITTTDSRIESREGLKSTVESYYRNPNTYTSYDYSVHQSSEPDTKRRPGPMTHQVADPQRHGVYVSETSGMYACREYRCSPAGTLIYYGNSHKGQFLIDSNIDEDGNRTLVFSNLFGQKVLERRLLSDTQFADTYYVYDPYGELRYMLSPECSRALESSSAKTWNSDMSPLDELAFYYEYSIFGGVVTKSKVPGQEYIKYYCDKDFQPVMRQDGNQREKGVWSFCIYDDHRRPALEGELKATDTQARNFAQSNMCAVRNASGAYSGYRIERASAFNPDNIDIVRYYDDYDFIQTIDRESVLSFDSSAGGDARYANATGRSTGLLVSGLGSATYYNKLGSPVQNCQELKSDGYSERVSTKYNYAQQPLTVSTVNSGQLMKSYSDKLSYSYDRLGRPVQVSHSIGNNLAQVISSNTYTDLSQTASNSIANGKYAIKYSYDMVGRLGSIVSPSFSQYLTYEMPGSFNGNIKMNRWKSGENAYKFANYQYDSLNRLVGATLNGQAHAAYSYDLNCNPLTIQRYGAVDREEGEAIHGLIDDATMTYVGNQLQRSDDKADYLSYAGANDLPNGVAKYTYDANGNMDSDSGRGIRSIRYNRLNLPEHIDFGSGSSIGFRYDALGRKLAQTDTLQNRQIANTQYLGRLVCSANSSPEQPEISRILIPGGYLTPNGNGYAYHYFVNDYQGNVRAVIDSNGHAEEINDYYPDGLLMPAADATIPAVQPYKFTGKERLAFNGLNVYDYGPRHLNPALLAFATSDNKAAKYPWTSPYVYCAGDPINKTDPSGEEWRDINGNVIKDASQIQVFIFYSKDFETQAIRQFEKAAEIYGESNVALSLTSDFQTFEEDWSNMSGTNISEVKILTHGKNQSLHLGNQQMTATGDGTLNISSNEAPNVQDLPTPTGNISKATLYFYSCHSADARLDAHGEGQHAQGPLKGTKKPIAEVFARQFNFKKVIGTAESVNYYDLRHVIRLGFSQYYMPYPTDGIWKVYSRQSK